jgi:hypothetical protein
MNKKPTSRIKGSAIALVLFAVIILLIIGAAVLSLGMHTRLVAVRTAGDISARCAADAGLVKALFVMNERLKKKPWTDSNLPGATESLPNSDAAFSYTVTGDSIKGYVIESIGECGSSTKTVTCTLGVRGPFETALFGNKLISLKSGTTINSYNMLPGQRLKIGTNSINAGSIIARLGVTINGDVFVGVGGDPNVVIDTKNEAVITGDCYPLTEVYEIPKISVPKYLVDMTSIGTIKTSMVLTGPTKCDGISLTSGQIIVINGPVVLYVDGEVVLDYSSQLLVVDEAVNPDAFLNIYLNGNFWVKNSSAVNNIAKDARKLKIYGLEGCEELQFQIDSVFCGAIYAPKTDLMMQNSVEIFGSLITETFIQQVDANFHYYGALKEGSVHDEMVHFVVDRWNE